MTILTRQEAQRAVGKGLTGTPSADQLLTLDEFTAAVDEVIEGIVGPVNLATRTFTTRCRDGALTLPWPYLSVVSVTVDGVAVDAMEYDDITDADRGLLWPITGFAPWSRCAGGRVTVVAQVGFATVPAHIRSAAMELVRTWWRSSQQGGHAPSDDAVVYTPRAVPATVRDLLQASPMLPGFG